MMAKSLQAPRYRSLPAMLRRLRKQAGLTERALAKKMGMSHVMVHNSETAERRVDVTEFRDWCVACGVDPLAAFAELLKK